MDVGSVAVSLLGFEITLPVVLLGTIIGSTYGILAVGLVLVYRSNRIINFAHGQMGAFGASLFLLLVTNDTLALPYYVALPVAMVAAMALGAGSEVLVIRRLSRAPRIMSIVATLGLGQFLLLVSLVINPSSSASSLYPAPPGLPQFQVGPLLVTQSYVGMLVFVPMVVVAIALFLRRSRYGLAIRAAAANPEAARLEGIPVSRMSSVTWAIAGALSALSAILYAPSSGFMGASSVGPSLLLRALVAAVFARFTSLPIALGVGVGIGVVEQVLLWNHPSGGLVEMVLFAGILVGLLAQRGMAGRSAEQGSWAALQSLKPLPERLATLRSVRNLPWTLGAVVVAGLLLLPAVLPNATAVTMVGLFAFVIVGLSVGIVTGLNGQLSLGQFGLAAVGAVVSYHVSSQSGNFILAFVYAGLVAALVSLVIGIPALRIRGLMLAVTTLGFGLVTQVWVLQQPWALGGGVDPGRPILAGHALSSGKQYYLLALGITLLCYLLARNVWRSGLRRQLVAVRDNEDNARAFTVPATIVKLQAFLLAGFIAGIGGALYGHSLARISVATFPVDASITVAVMAVIGGVGVLSGPVLGALLVIGVPAFLPLDAAGLAATSLGQLLILMYLPSGLAGLIEPVRDRLVDVLARRAGVDPAQVRAEAESPVVAVTPERTTSLEVATQSVRQANEGTARGAVLLEARDLRKHFGGVRAVDGVSLRVRAGQVVGLIGPNGAGKTTTFELLGGFTPPDQGTVTFAGEDVSRATPEERASLGLVRSFQGAPLFPTMTVLETVHLSLEKQLPTRMTESLLGYSRREATKQARARELVNLMGLDLYRNKVIGELSTGTRRITEIACLIALEPSMLLLDEPASGVAQREIEAMTGLLLQLRKLLRTTFLVIEHDIPMIMSISDRVIAMDAGRIIAAGTPEAVRNDPAVVDAYLGGDTAAIERSGSRRPPARAAATPVAGTAAT